MPATGADAEQFDVGLVGDNRVQESAHKLRLYRVCDEKVSRLYGCKGAWKVETMII